MSLATGALGMGRSWAESLMTDTVRIIRRTPTGVLDETTGQPGYTEATIYEGKCRLVLRSNMVRDVDAQSQLLAIQGPRLDVPVAGTGDIKNADVFTMLTSETDAELVGVSGHISGMFPQSYATARRLPVEVSS